MNIFKKIGMMFTSLWTIFFHSTQELFNKQPQEVKDAFAKGIGFTELLKVLSGKALDEVYKTASEKLGLSETSVNGIMDWIGNFFNWPIDDKDELLFAINQKITSVSKEEFARVANAIGQGAVQFLAPTDTPFKIITFFAEWFYQKYIKKAID